MLQTNIDSLYDLAQSISTANSIDCPADREELLSIIETAILANADCLNVKQILLELQGEQCEKHGKGNRKQKKA